MTLLDARSSVPEKFSADLKGQGVELRTGVAPLKAQGGHGVRALTLAETDGSGWRESSTENCDLVLVSGGWSPVVNLLSHRGVKPKWNAENACFLPGDTTEPVVRAPPQLKTTPMDDALARAGLAGATGLCLLRARVAARA